MSTLNVNGRDHTVDADPATPILWALRDTLGMTGTKFGCGAGAVRRLHRAPGRPGHPLVRHADLGGRGQEDHHHRSRHRRQRPRRQGRARRLGQARRGAVRLLPERPDHERDRVPEVAAQGQAAHRRRDRRRHGRQHLPLRHLRPHPRRRGRRRHRPSPEGATMLPNFDRSEMPRALQHMLARGRADERRHAAAPQLPEAGRCRRPRARRLPAPGHGAGHGRRRPTA